jgi:hypothetical protein
MPLKTSVFFADQADDLRKFQVLHSIWVKYLAHKDAARNSGRAMTADELNRDFRKARNLHIFVKLRLAIFTRYCILLTR